MQLYPFVVNCDQHNKSVRIETYSQSTYGYIWEQICGSFSCDCPASWMIIIASGQKFSYAEAKSYGIIRTSSPGNC